MTSQASSSRVPSFSKPNFFDRAGSDGWFCNVCTPSHNNYLQPMSSEAAVAHETKSDDHARNVQDFEMWNPHPQGTWVMPEDDTPLTFEELKTRARQVHVDQVRDMVPFWMQGVRAAEKGEVLRMEDFLEKMAAEDRWGVNGVDDPWGPSIGPWPSDHPWGAAVPPIEADPWADIEKDPWGKVDQDPWGKMSGWGAEEDSTLSAHVDRSVSHRKGNHQRNKGGAKGKGKKGKVNGKTKPRDTFLFVEDIARQQAVDADRKQRMHEFFEMPTQDKVKKIEDMVRKLRSING